MRLRDKNIVSYNTSYRTGQCKLIGANWGTSYDIGWGASYNTDQGIDCNVNCRACRNIGQNKLIGIN